MPHNALIEEIVKLSSSPIWERARFEWSLSGIFLEDEPDTCLCGHSPIFEMCVLHNRVNGNEAVVGNVCVNKFIGLPSDSIFRSVKRIIADPTRSLGDDAISYAYGKNWLSDWERRFCSNTKGKRRLSRSQRLKRIEINDKVIELVCRNRPR